MSEPAEAQLVRAHYQFGNAMTSILNALESAGVPLDTLTVDDLAPVDQFHMGGKRSTLEMIALAEIAPGDRVLDAGGGIGGPARTIASAIECHVTVLDLSEAFCEAGEELTKLTRLSDRVSFVNGNALSTPFEDGSFDVVWTQHSSMNIDDKDQLYRELFRVLRPGGRLAIHEIVAGDVAPVYFPVPWASLPESSFLRTSDAVRAAITGAGFHEVTWKDVSAGAIAFWRHRQASAAAETAPPLLSIGLLLGPSFGEISANIGRNLEEDRVRVIQALFVKP